MPDVMHEGARVDYDDAFEVGGCGDCEDVVGVATFSVDRLWGGKPTGQVDPLPIRVYVLDVEGDLSGDAGDARTGYLTLDSARELVEVLDAAILQVELTRHSRRRSP